MVPVLSAAPVVVLGSVLLIEAPVLIAALVAIPGSVFPTKGVR